MVPTFQKLESAFARHEKRLFLERELQNAGQEIQTDSDSYNSRRSEASRAGIAIAALSLGEKERGIIASWRCGYAYS